MCLFKFSLDILQLLCIFWDIENQNVHSILGVLNIKYCKNGLRLRSSGVALHISLSFCLVPWQVSFVIVLVYITYAQFCSLCRNHTEIANELLWLPSPPARNLAFTETTWGYLAVLNDFPQELQHGTHIERSLGWGSC